MSNQPDEARIKVLAEQAEKLDEQSKHKVLRALHSRMNRAVARIGELKGAEEPEAQAKNAPLVEELRKRVAELREEIRKTVAAAGKQGRKQLKRVQRRIQKLRVVPFDDLQKRVQKQSEIIGKQLSDMTKGMKKSQANPYVHSLRKKTKSLNKKLKKFARIAKKKEAAAGEPKS